MRLFVEEKSRSDILREVLFSLPSAELRKGITWHIGNITYLDEDGLYFRIGRISKSTVETYKDGNFLDQKFETAPYTHVVLDNRLEVCAIAKKTKLLRTAAGIARRFVELLLRSEKAQLFDVEFDIDEINDPEDFITNLYNAYLILKFWVTFSRPNAFDASDFVKPYMNFLEVSNGEKGKVEIEAKKGLNLASLVDVTRSAATMGSDAGASILEKKGGKSVRKYLSGNPVVISEEDLTDDQQRKRFLQRVREQYWKIRGNGGAQGEQRY
jgi:acyl-CoA synthetase (AMP-forming)/AMP-acid ligase II